MPQTFAEVVVELGAQRRTEFDDRVIRANAEAVVALEAVAAREAAAGLEERVLLGQSPDDLVEGAPPPGLLELGTPGPRGV
jgi:hypothetical protein